MFRLNSWHCMKYSTFDKFISVMENTFDCYNKDRLIIYCQCINVILFPLIKRKQLSVIMFVFTSSEFLFQLFVLLSRQFILIFTCNSVNLLDVRVKLFVYVDGTI